MGQNPLQTLLPMKVGYGVEMRLSVKAESISYMIDVETEMMEKKKQENERVLGFSVARQLSEEEIAMVSGAGDPSWSNGCGGRCTEQDDTKPK